ncbi:MAG: RNase adapter RapZ [Acidimicrobiales bacterium]|nr:RNase adapter RapZ [Acidimicrobiales bacterium]
MSSVVVVTGLAGAGRSTAAGTFEDLGWFVIDNLPVALVSKVGELASGSSERYEKVVLVMQGFDSALEAEVAELRKHVKSVQVLFLDASTRALVQRYESTKRRHPGVVDGSSVLDAIEHERELYATAKGAADLVIDTTDMNPHQLRDRVTAMFDEPDSDTGMRITVSSFGYKHGIPTDVDLVLDCRFLPNPHWEPELRKFSGMDQPVADFVLGREITLRFLDRLSDLLVELLPAYAKEGRSYLGIAFGCTGGRHRSVAVAEEMARRLSEDGWNPGLRHRDVDR